jgi:hypothetical protein
MIKIDTKQMIERMVDRLIDHLDNGPRLKSGARDDQKTRVLLTDMLTDAYKSGFREGVIGSDRFYESKGCKVV